MSSTQVLCPVKIYSEYEIAAAATLGIVCAITGVIIGLFMYRRHLYSQRVIDFASMDQRQEAEEEEEVAETVLNQNSIPALNIPLVASDSKTNLGLPPSPVMQQCLLQRELVKNYGSFPYNHNNSLLKPPPYRP